MMPLAIRLFAAAFSLLLCVIAGAAPASRMHGGVTASAPPPPNPSNTITVSTANGAAPADYPMQFGRPFIQGQIPHAPQVLIDGVPATSQADVKNRYPDGSVEFAVISVHIPAMSQNACDITADTPGDGVPYALWTAHGNSPVFAKLTNTTDNPLYQSLDNANCGHFSGNVSRTVFSTTNPRRLDGSLATWGPTGGQPDGSGMGFTENPPFPAPDVGGQLYAVGTGFSSSSLSTTLSNPGVIWGTDGEGGYGTSYSYIPDNVDTIGATTYDGAMQCTFVYGQPPGSCGPMIVEPINTADNYNWGADGDHEFNGILTSFEQMWVRGVLSSMTITAVQAAKAAYYATPGSPSPVECSISGVTCDMALSLTHRMMAGATKAFKLWNATTHAFQDIGFDSNGNTDTTAALSFCGTVSNCNYVTIYDQVAQVAVLSAPTSHVLTFQDTLSTGTPMTLGAMEALLPVNAAKMVLTSGAHGGTADAGQMLLDGKCAPWTQGAVAQTMMCADDTATRSYDIGFGDGFHPVRPRFYVTFWPGTSQVYVRAVVENDLATELEDTAYTAVISSGGSTVYSADLSGTVPQKKHWAQSVWTYTFWVGGAPSPHINIDNNLAYLDSTRFFPNFDPSVTLSIGNTATNYLNWFNSAHDIYDGDWDGGLWRTAMGSGGVSSVNDHIGPVPQYISYWLFSPSWQARTAALNEADIAGAWPLNLRESDTTRIYRRGDTPGTGTGLGRNVSLAGRPTAEADGNSDNWTYVGSCCGSNWTVDTDHQPQVWFFPYVLTGDPWYLNELYQWTGYSAFIATQSAPYVCTNQVYNCSYFRGPTGAYGGISYGNNDSAREAAWSVRGRAETAFAAPDGTVEKSYFQTLVNDELAKWEGALGINGTAFDTATVKTWVESTIYPYYPTVDAGSPPTQGVIPPLNNYGWYHTTGESNVVITGWIEEPWMVHYLTYALGRTSELGFASKQIQAHYNQWEFKIINSSLPQFLSDYLAVTYYDATSTLITNIEDTYNPAFYTSGYLTGLVSNFASDVSANGDYAVLAGSGLAMAVDEGVTGAAAAWTWYNTNGYSLSTSISARPSKPMWAIVPRTDTNVLPAQPTATPP